MEPSEFDWIIWLWNVFWELLVSLGRILGELQARYPQVFSPQTLFGLIGTTIAIWKWWEAREASLFRKFEELIARNEAQLVKARNDLLDVMIRPGPGVRIWPPLFAESLLRDVLFRRRWHPVSLFPLTQATDRRLQQAVETSNRKVAAHELRLSFYRQEIVSARLIQGALAASRAASSTELHERQFLNQRALDKFNAVLELPDHAANADAHELIAFQLAHIDQHAAGAVNAHEAAIELLEARAPSPRRNLSLARLKRNLAVLQYSDAPGVALALLAQASNLLSAYGPRRDRDLLELADTLLLESLTRFRLGHGVRGPIRLSQAHGHYQDLLRSLRARKRGLFSWMFRTRRYAGHRVQEINRSALAGLALAQHLIRLTQRHRNTVTANLQRGHGVRRHNRRPLPPPQVH